MQLKRPSRYIGDCFPFGVFNFSITKKLQNYDNSTAVVEQVLGGLTADPAIHNNKNFGLNRNKKI